MTVDGLSCYQAGTGQRRKQRTATMLFSLCSSGMVYFDLYFHVPQQLHPP